MLTCNFFVKSSSGFGIQGNAGLKNELYFWFFFKTLRRCYLDMKYPKSLFVEGWDPTGVTIEVLDLRTPFSSMNQSTDNHD